MSRNPTLFAKLVSCGVGILLSTSSIAGTEIEFPLLATLDVGQAPHQISFSADGRRAYVAGAGSDWIAEIDAATFELQRKIPAPNVPLGVFPLAGGKSLGVSQFFIDALVRIDLDGLQEVARLDVGGAPSLFSGPLPDDRWAYVNNTASHDVSVIDLETRQVVSRFPVPKIPIVMAVHPAGRSLWVASEGDHLLSIYAIPELPQQAPAATDNVAAAEVLVMGMIHGRHLSSQQWGLAQIRQTILNIKPDIVCAEIPPARWATAWPEFQETGTVTDERIVRFPEYVEVLLPLQSEMGFTIEPCAAWTREMAQLRQTRIEAWNSADLYKGARQAYEQEMAELAAAGGMDYDAVDDPRVIHSAAYDQAVEAELSIYDRYQNDRLGPGGWSNINQAHFALIKGVIERHPGKRILITFGAGHKYWFLQQLRQRSDVKLLDLRRYLPATAATSSNSNSNSNQERD